MLYHNPVTMTKINSEGNLVTYWSEKSLILYEQLVKELITPDYFTNGIQQTI